MKCIVLAILSIGICVINVFGDALDDKIEELIGTNVYSTNKNFIDNIFQDRPRFFINNRLDIVAVVSELKNNGLIMLKFPSPRDLNISFISNTSPILLAFTINNILQSMGYSYFIPTKSSLNDGVAHIGFSFATEHAIDPTILLNELDRRGFALNDMRKKSIDDWVYVITPKAPKLFNAKTLIPNNPLRLREVSGEYWLNLNRSGQLHINANRKWTPRVVFYDRDLRIVNIIISDKTMHALNVKINNNVSFVMIGDAQNPRSIKEIEVLFSNL